MRIDLDETKKRIETNLLKLRSKMMVGALTNPMIKASALLSFWNGEKAQSISQASYYPKIQEDFFGFVVKVDNELKQELNESNQ